ncbi:lipopolysaccharide biosynthesis protein [Raoultibacter phocaeensis]|uniref:lipopolysaccharide biosynthesis protein n=1 Tax=Raoultibacter phocaeensis TaxID=2479841 RepID=UPI0011181EA3|nr:lipopolysaccharide biosynthesis protein [Raoultibacter phocaeensis]
MSSNTQIKKDYFWNTLGSAMSAVASVLLLMVVTQSLGAYVGGIFALAFAVAQQFQTLGQYEVRPYQATDVEDKFSFGVYYAARIVTCGLMIAGIVLYAIYSNGLGYEAVLLVLVGWLRFFDAFEDVFHGMFQQRGRLDIAGKAFFWRVLSTVVSFSVTAFLARDIFVACVVSIVVSTITFVVLNIPPARSFVTIKPIFDFKKIRQLLVACFPLFLGSFLLMYLVNAPRYGIEEVLSKEFQTYYAILFMPAMVINLISGFIFKPLLTTLANHWKNGSRRGFASIIAKGLAAVAVTSVFALVVAYFIGIPVLSFLYGVDLSGYRPVLMTLLVGGAFNAASVILYYGLITTRHQGAILPGYAIAALAALLFSRLSIEQFGMMGAAYLYDGVMVLLVVIFAALNVYFVKRAAGVSKRP